MKPPYDQIDIIVARIFEMDPGYLCSKTRNGRVVSARFLAILLRTEKEPDVSHEKLGEHYNKKRGAIRHAIQQARNLLKYNKGFRKQYEAAQFYLNEKRLPYAPDLIRPGAKVWTRPDSAGEVFQGRVTSITDTLFTVESFEDQNFKITNWLDTGRIHRNCESSLDIISVQP